MTISIEKLQDLSDKLNDRMECYNTFSSSEAEFGSFMKVASIELGLVNNNVIGLEQMMQYVLVDGQKLITALIVMRLHLTSWKSQVDLKIEELKSREFPNEIIL